jgi:hypothetical protein
MKTKALLLLLLAAAVIPARPADRQLSIWVDEQVRLDRFLRALFLSEMSRGAAGRLTEVRFSSDSIRPNSGAVVMTLKFAPPSRYPQALGLARTSKGRILPVIEIYVDPVAKLLPPNSPPADLGRALGRVAAHELLHYVSQRAGHDASGFFSESLGPEALVESSESDGAAARF